MPTLKSIRLKAQHTSPANNMTEPSEQLVDEQNLEEVSQSVAGGKPKEETRKFIAYVYVSVFLIIVGLTLVFMLLRCYSIIDIKDMLLAESGILSGPLGFIIGFYFKEELEKK